MINFVKAHSIFKDRQAVMLMSVGSALALLIVGYVLLMVESRDFKVEVRYSGYNRTLTHKGEWYTLYLFPLFAVTTHLLNSFLSLRAHQIQRTIAITILSFNIVVLVFTLIVSRSLLQLL